MIPVEFWQQIGASVQVLTVLSAFYVASKIAQNFRMAANPPVPKHVTNNYKLQNCTLTNPEDLR